MRRRAAWVERRGGPTPRYRSVDRAAGNGSAFEHRPAPGGKMAGGGKFVDAGADDDRVVALGPHRRLIPPDTSSLK